MASNKSDWAPLPQRKNGGQNRKGQAKLLSQLKEMFGSNFEADIISSVAQNCDWKLEPSIDMLITLSSGGQQQPQQRSSSISEPQSTQKSRSNTTNYPYEVFDPWPADENATVSLLEYQGSEEKSDKLQEPEEDLMSFDENELQQQQEELRKFELAKAKDEESSGAVRREPSDVRREPSDVRREPSDSGQKHVETASLCGLKVEYRPRGMENNSDDDADVVIEEESCDLRSETPEPERANVCQFLSRPTQSAPKITFPQVNYISTPSPPRTPRRAAAAATKENVPPAVAHIDSINQQGYKILVLMRGVPGSGKSYLSKSIVSKVPGIKDPKLHILSTDDYFILINRGVYVFDITKLQDAHAFNQNRVRNFMREGRSPLIVDNTNTQAWEMRAYATMAVQHGYIVETLEPNTPWFRNVNELEKRNKHHVPKAKIRQMLDRYEPNISGERLIKMFDLHYDSFNRPPQVRSCPPVDQEILAQRVRELSLNSPLPRPAQQETFEPVDNKLLAPMSRSMNRASPMPTQPTTYPLVNQEILEQKWNPLALNSSSPLPEQQPPCTLINHENLEQRLHELVMNSPSPIPKQSHTHPPTNQEILAQRVDTSATRSPPPLPAQRRARKPRKPVVNEAVQEDKQQWFSSDALNAIAKEYENLEAIFQSKNNKSLNDANESWTEGSSYKEESSIDLMKLGAIGSERKGTALYSSSDEESTPESSPTQILKAIGSERKNSVHALESAPESSPTQMLKAIGSERKNSVHALEATPESSPTLVLRAIGSERKNSVHALEATPESSPTLVLRAIGSERKNSVHALDDVQNVEQKIESTEEPKVDVLHQCWDFTLIRNGEKIHSKLDDTKTNDNDESPLKIESENNDSVRCYSESAKMESKPSEDENNTQVEEESIMADVTIKEPSTPSDKASSDGSLERVSDVDISQYELCNTETLQQPTTVEQESNSMDAEKQSSGGFGSLLSFIKNSFLGNEKESDTLSSKVSNFSINNKKQNLNQDAEKSAEISNMSETSLEVDEFFEARESMSEDLLQSESAPSVVEQLLEASSDFQLVEQHNYTETRLMMTKPEETCNIVSEKSFVEQIKNLQVNENSEEDENKVSKEPIDKVFVSKNTFPEKIQNISRNILSVDWQESPFPLDDVIVPSQPVANLEPASAKPPMCESATYTDPYDFNVAYVGGTDEFKVIDAVNRSINESSVIYDAAAYFPIDASGSLKLHKGTMTNKTSVLDSEQLFDLETDSTIEERGQELIDKYPHLPAECVIDVYENMCKRDYNWACEYLKSLIEEDATITAVTLDSAVLAAQDQFFTSNKGAVSRQHSSPSESSSDNVASSESVQQSPARISSKRSRDRQTPDELALKRNLENKFVLSKESYRPHTLRVKRWKNRDFSPKHSDTVDVASLVQPQPVQPITTTTSSLLDWNTKKTTRLDNPAMVEEQPITGDPDSNSEGNSSEEEEMMELKLGYDFIRILEAEFGNSGFQSDGLFPVIQIKRSMAQELHALWIESMQRQLWVMQEQLDSIIARDAEYARTLEAEEARAVSSPEVPNLREIMDMEMALATYNNDLKIKYRKESPTEISSRVAQQTLREMFPHYDSETLLAIYEAHDRNFEMTVKLIEENCTSKSKLTMADVLKKRKDLIDELQKSGYQVSSHNQLEMDEGRDEASGGYGYDDGDEEHPLTYEDAVKLADEQRREARRHSNLRNDNYQKAVEAIRKKSPEVAAYYSEMAKLHIRKMELANSTAASAILAAQAHSLEAEDTLDLHYLHVAEAKEALQVYLDNQFQEMSRGERKHIFIITGRGARSSNGQSKIKPAVAKELNNRNIMFMEANPGMLKATLRK